MKVACWNAGMDTADSCQRLMKKGASMQNLVESVIDLADTCHVVGVNGLHPRHAAMLQQMLATRRPQLVTKSFDSHDAIVWNPTLVAHMESKVVLTHPAGNRYQRCRKHVECRFETRKGTVDDAEWILMVIHLRSGEGDMQVPG